MFDCIVYSSVVVYPSLSSALSCLWSTCSPGVYESCFSANFPPGTWVTRPIETVFRTLSSLIVVIFGDAWITPSGPVLRGISLLNDSVTSGTETDVVIGGGSR